jgi:hypothetical protein
MRYLLVAAVAAAAIIPATPSFAAVDYVRMCSLFGKHYYYDPGSETCINADTGDTKTKETDGSITNGETTLAKTARDAKEGVALTMALPTPTVTPGHTFAAGAKVGIFQGEYAVGVGGAYQANDNLSIDGNFGVGLQRGTVGGSAGVNYSW